MKIQRVSSEPFCLPYFDTLCLQEVDKIGACIGKLCPNINSVLVSVRRHTSSDSRWILTIQPLPLLQRRRDMCEWHCLQRSTLTWLRWIFRILCSETHQSLHRIARIHSVEWLVECLQHPLDHLEGTKCREVFCLRKSEPSLQCPKDNLHGILSFVLEGDAHTKLRIQEQTAPTLPCPAAKIDLW